jgi:signal transduction histidine kinase
LKVSIHKKPQRLSANDDDDRVEEFYKVKKSMNNLIEELNNYKEVLEALLQNKTELLQERNVEVKGLLEDLKKAQALIIQQEKLSALGVLSAGISHELKNPLNISINTGLMLKDVIIESSVDEELKQELLKLIDTIVNNNKRMNNIIQSMLLQSRTSKDPLQEVKN